MSKNWRAIQKVTPKHIQFEKGKKSSLDRLVLPGMDDLYLALDKCN